MQKANNYFILAGVADHILADFRTFDNTTLFNFRHEDDQEPNRLQIQVTRAGNEYVISYDAEYNGRSFMQAKSDPLPANYIQEAIAQIVNDTIPQGAPV